MSMDAAICRYLPLPAAGCRPLPITFRVHPFREVLQVVSDPCELRCRRAFAFRSPSAQRPRFVAGHELDAAFVGKQPAGTPMPGDREGGSETGRGHHPGVIPDLVTRLGRSAKDETSGAELPPVNETIREGPVDRSCRVFDLGEGSTRFVELPECDLSALFGIGFGLQDFD